MAPRPRSARDVTPRTGITTVSMGDTDVAELDAKLDTLGWNRSFFFRRVARQMVQGDYFDPEVLPPEIRAEVRAYSKELLGIAADAQRAYEAIVVDWFKHRLEQKKRR